MPPIFPLLIALICAFPATAQDRAGRNTPGEWIVDHQNRYGLWDSLCDHRLTGDTREERCYLRYVDVFSPRPRFAAQFLFVTPGPEVEIGMERGTRFAQDGIRILQGATVAWSTDRDTCLRGRACTFDGQDATALLAAMQTGDVFAFDFTDRHGQPQALRWDLAPFAAALADFQTETAARGL